MPNLTPAQQAKQKARSKNNGNNAPKGEKSRFAKLKEAEAFMIKCYPPKYGSIKQLCNLFNVSRNTVSNIRHGRAWRHLKKPTSHERVYAKLYVDGQCGLYKNNIVITTSA